MQLSFMGETLTGAVDALEGRLACLLGDYLLCKRTTRNLHCQTPQQPDTDNTADAALATLHTAPAILNTALGKLILAKVTTALHTHERHRKQVCVSSREEHKYKVNIQYDTDALQTFHSLKLLLFSLSQLQKVSLTQASLYMHYKPFKLLYMYQC